MKAMDSFPRRKPNLHITSSFRDSWFSPGSKVILLVIFLASFFVFYLQRKYAPLLLRTVSFITFKCALKCLFAK